MPTQPTFSISSAAELDAFLRSRISTSLPGMRMFMKSREPELRTASHWKSLISVSLQALLNDLLTYGTLKATAPAPSDRMRWLFEAADKLKVTVGRDLNGEEFPFIDTQGVGDFVFPPQTATAQTQRRVPLSNYVATVMGQSRSQGLSYREMERGLERRALREVLRPSGVSDAVASVAKEVQEELLKEEQQQKQQEKVREVAASGLGRVIDID